MSTQVLVPILEVVLAIPLGLLLVLATHRFLQLGGVVPRAEERGPPEGVKQIAEEYRQGALRGLNPTVVQATVLELARREGGRSCVNCQHSMPAEVATWHSVEEALLTRGCRLGLSAGPGGCDQWAPLLPRSEVRAA